MGTQSQGDLPTCKALFTQSCLCLNKELDNHIVLMGMSCVGKTTFGDFLKKKGMNLYHFDLDFTYSLTALEGVSRLKNWEQIIKRCKPPYVLDNWTTEDTKGQVLAKCDPAAVICVLFDSRKNILSRYRADIMGEDAYRGMYEKMYCRMKFEIYKQFVRFFLVEPHGYTEYNLHEFRQFIGDHLVEDIGMTYDPDSRKWNV